MTTELNRKSYINDDINDKNSYMNFYKLSDEQQTTLLTWCMTYLHKRQRVNRAYSTYSLKRIFEHYHFRVTNGQMKGALYLCGFEFDDIRFMSAHANVSMKSIQRVRKK